MATPLSVCTKGEQRSVIRFFMVGRCIRVRNPSKTFGTVREQCIAATECLRMHWKTKKCCRNVTHDNGVGRPSTIITEDNIECRRHMVLLDEWLLMKWHMFYKLSMVRPTNWCTTNLSFIKSVQDGSQHNSQRCINKRAWTSAKNIWIALETNENHLRQNHHWWRNMGTLLRGGEWTAEHGMDTSTIVLQEKVKNPTIRRNDVFWDSQGPVLEHYQEKGITMNSARYSEMHTDRLKPAIRSKRRGLLSKSVVLLQDNARTHTVASKRSGNSSWSNVSSSV